MAEKSEIRTRTLTFTDMEAPDFKPVENTKSVVRVFRTTEPQKPVAKKGKVIYHFSNKNRTYGRKNKALF